MFRNTVRTKLMKKKLSLSALLHETIQRQRDEIKSHMFKFPYFDKWTEQTIHQCCVHSNVLSFEEDDLIHETLLVSLATQYATKFTIRLSIAAMGEIPLDEYGILKTAIDGSLAAYQRLEQREKLVESFPLFKLWSGSAVKRCSLESSVRAYEKDEVLAVKDDANVYVTYFVLEGSATVIQRLVVEKYKLKGDKQHRYRLHPNQQLSPTQKTNRTEFVFMQTCILKEGACFGLGKTAIKELVIHTAQSGM